jgi:flagellar motor switch/type III secretory pathway protein FliN
MSESTPVQIKFQVGEARVALSDLLNLAPGAVLEGEAVYTYFPKVRAILGERQIAEGELVKVDGKVGFRVTKVL